MISSLNNLADIVIDIIKNNKKINNKVIKVIMAYIKYSEGKINLEELYESVKSVKSESCKVRKPQPYYKCNFDDENKLKQKARTIENMYFKKVDEIESGEINNEYEQK